MDEITASFEATKDRFEERQIRLADTFGYPATAECKALLNECRPPLAAFITAEFRQPIHTKLPPGLRVPLRRLDPNVIAISALARVLVSLVTRPIDDCDDPTWKKQTWEKIGEDILGECRRRRKVFPPRKKTKQPSARYQSSDWPRQDIIRAGQWLEDCIVWALPHVFFHDEDGTIHIWEAAVDRARAVAHQLMLRNPVLVPSKKRLSRWTEFRTGCYWTPQSRISAPFVRTHGDDVVERAIRAAWNGSLRPHVAAVNAQQAVPWIIDEQMLEVVKRFGPYRWPDDERLFRLDMAMAEHLRGEAFYIPKNIDWRGRFYGIPRFSLEQQDWVRSLLKFYNGYEIGEDGTRWLKIYTATTGDFGRISKRPFDERIAWVEKNRDKIDQVAADPFEAENAKWWGQAGTKKKYRFLAGCVELSKALRVGPSFVSHLPISFDATASGIQHLCAMSRADEGEEVNLTPRDTPQDVYQKGFDRVTDEMEDEVWAEAELERWIEVEREKKPGQSFKSGYPEPAFFYLVLFDRKLLKQPIMTRFYNSPLGGTTNQIMEKREQDDSPIDREAASNLARRIRSVTDQLLPKSLEVTKFLGQCAKKLAEKNKPLSWTSPSGLPVSVRCYPSSTDTIEIRTSGKPHWHNIATGHEPVIDKNEAVNSAASNFIHSCDAAHMAFVTNRAVAEGIVDLAMVHDCFGCPAAQASRFREIIREEFVRMYEENEVLEDLRKRVAHDLGTDSGLPEVPKRGKLDLKDVLRSEFAFD